MLPDTRLIHVARLLKWNAFRDAFPGTPRRYDATFTVEPLTPAHDAFLAANSGVVRSFDLSLDPESGAENSCAGLPRPVWLVVHSGPAAEVHRLLEFAAVRAGEERAAPQFVVVSPRALALPTGVTHLAHPRAWELFAPADRIVTACGFNSMLEASPWRGKHLYLPFERRFDDQHLRAQRATSLQC